MKRKSLGEKTKPKGKVKKQKASVEEELGLTGNETANELYTLYIKARMGSSEKAIVQAKKVWVKKYYEEKGKK